MGWVQKFSDDDFLCFEQTSKSISCRIESRKTAEGWIIYKSFFSQAGINFTEEYVAPTFDKMKQVVMSLQKEKLPSVREIQQKILEKSKRVSVQIEREYKEYGVEKWKFGLNKDPHMNFVVVRCYEEIDMDFVVHEAYRHQEHAIIREIVEMLGFDGMEDILNINIYYFTKHNTKSLEPTKQESIDFI